MEEGRRRVKVTLTSDVAHHVVHPLIHGTHEDSTDTNSLTKSLELDPKIVTYGLEGC